MKTVVRPIQSLRQSYQSMIDQKEELNPKTLNLTLLANPFLKDYDHFRSIGHELNLYNKRILDHLLTDHYEVKSHQKLFTLISDLANLGSPQAMTTRLEEIWKWWGEQKRKMKQRKDLGVIKYKTDRQAEKLREFRERMSQSEVAVETRNLPNEIRFSELQPYENKNRTAHKEMQIPLKRLSEYKIKRINLIDTHLKGTQDSKPQQERVLYLRPPKYVPPEEEQPQNPQAPPVENNQGLNVNPEGTTNPESPNKEGVNPEQVVEKIDSTKLPEGEDPNQQDIGGFGQEAGEPEQEVAEEQGPGQDKLAPKNKIYTWSNKEREQYEKQKKYQRPYMHYRGNDSTPERRMEEKAFLRQQYSLEIKREEEEMVELAHKWASKKQKIDKQREFLLENRLAKPKYSFSYEDPATKQMLSVADQKKYGFYIPTKTGTKNQIQLDDKLPQIGQSKPIERELRKDRLKSLKDKFGTILNLRESLEEPTKNSSTLCQTSPRRRDLSMILEDHSLEKERLRQLDQIQRIKESLGKHRININIRTLSQALVPDSEDYKREQFGSPSKELPSNPFWVQTKKKKKKK